MPSGQVEPRYRYTYFKDSIHENSAYVLVIVGAVNWGLVGLSGFLGGGNWNVVNLILGSWPQVEWLVYVLVGISGVWVAFTHKKDCMMCKGKM